MWCVLVLCMEAEVLILFCFVLGGRNIYNIYTIYTCFLDRLS